jgi:cellulose synthase/poly-beta-1,6-N-acetylglucosamine synthase-like glycosyltransferase
MELALSFGWMAFVFWLILRAYGQRGLLPVLRPVAAIIRDPPNISVIVPARNEGHNLPRCLDGLLPELSAGPPDHHRRQ